MEKNKIKVLQINVGGFDNNFSYLVFSENAISSKKISKEAILIDPTGNKNILEKAIQENNLKIKLVLLTHSHPDHCELKEHFKNQKIFVFEPQPKPLEIIETIKTPEIEVQVIHTPGHTPESVCYLIENNLFSGDTLFVKGIGTTAYGGNDETLQETLAFLSKLDNELCLWPGHSYGGNSSTLGKALKNSNIKPNEKIEELIKKKVEDYNNFWKEKKF